MTVARPVTILDLDTCVSYRLPTGASARNSAGDYGIYVKVLDGVAINHHATPNFDEKLNPAVPAVLKNQNVMTSDKVTCEISLDFRTEDIIHITTRHGETFWMTIVGEPTVRPITSHQTFYCTPTVAPKIA